MTKLLTPSTAIVALLTASAPALAQSDHLKGAVPLNIPRAFGSDTLPPEPSAAEHPHLHATWSKIPDMNTITPHLERREGVFHGPHVPAKGPAAGSAGGSGAFANSINWSGSAYYSYAANQYPSITVAMSVVVPKHEQAFGSNCSKDGNTYDAVWVGVDGWGTNTVEQAGLWIGVPGCGQPTMSAFIETYPDYEINITNFPVAAGDVISVFSTTDQAAQTECAVYVNESQNVRTLNTCIVAPGPFQARSMEWVVERPTYGNQYVNLANYVQFPISNAWAWNSKTGATLGAGSRSGCYIAGAPCAQTNNVAMLDNAGNMISYPSNFDPNMIMMYGTGSSNCAQAESCVPRY